MSFSFGFLAGAVVTILLVVVWSLCAVAKRADEQTERTAEERAENARRTFEERGTKGWRGLN